MEKKFLKLIESNITRSLRGGFLVGDYVEVVKDYKSHIEYKELHPQVKDAIEELVKSKLNIRVIGVNDTHPVRYSGNPDNMNGIVTLVIAADQGGSRRYNNVTVPSCICKTVDYYPNYAPIPDQFNYQAKITLKPEEFGDVESGMKGVTYSLPEKNVKLKKESTEESTYTSVYLEGLQ